MRGVNKMSRTKSTESTKTARISVKLHKEEKKAVVKKAKSKYMSISEYTRALYRKDLTLNKN